MLVDDHSRFNFKFIYLLKEKSEAKEKVNQFILELNAHANSNANKLARFATSTPTTWASSSRTSSSFKELLAGKGVAHTTFPPHVHQLNPSTASRSAPSTRSCGVRARQHGRQPSARHLLALGRAARRRRVINRTTGPPDSDITTGQLRGAHEQATVRHSWAPHAFQLPRPRQAEGVRAQDHHRRSRLTHALVGSNLGRSASSPVAYHV